MVSESPAPTCECNRRSAAFHLDGNFKCLLCAVRYPPMLRRSLLTAAVVGTILVAINQGTYVMAGDLPGSLVWKVPLTFLVPFCVTTWGALINSRMNRA